jgi:membrane protease YdiL (CAAX protease family)
MFVISTLKNISIWKSVKLSLRGGMEHLFESNINAMMLYTGALVFVSGVMDRIQELFGVQTGSLPSSDPLETFLGLTVAPLREEVGFRMLLIGSVTFLLSLPNVKEAIASLWKPCLSENSKRHPLLLASSIAISSFLFGLSHFTSGSGWQIGKVSEATYAGILLGYAYYKYGFHVAVMMHWTVDYFGSVYSFFGQGFAGIPWDSQNGYILSNAVALDLLILLGIAGTVVLAFRFFTKVIKFSAKEKMEPFL